MADYLVPPPAPHPDDDVIRAGDAVRICDDHRRSGIGETGLVKRRWLCGSMATVRWTTNHVTAVPVRHLQKIQGFGARKTPSS